MQIILKVFSRNCARLLNSGYNSYYQKPGPAYWNTSKGASMPLRMEDKIEI
jgi:hypothetical protein